MLTFWAVTTAWAAGQTVKIGVLYPLNTPQGEDLRAGAKLAADIANGVYQDFSMPMAARSGLSSLGGAKIELIFRNHKADPALGASLANRLIHKRQVVGILGCYDSGVTAAVAKVCRERGIPLINGCSTDPGLTGQGNPWFWRVTPHDQQFSQDLFNFLDNLTQGKVRGAPRVPREQIIRLAAACNNSAWGVNVLRELQALAARHKSEMVASELYAAASLQPQYLGNCLLANQPGCLLFASYATDAVAIIQMLKSMKAGPKLVWGQDAGFESPEFTALGPDINGVLTRTVFSLAAAREKKTAGLVNDLFRRRTGRDLNGVSSRAFTAMQCWANVLEKAGSTKPEAIKAACNVLDIPGKELIVPWQGIKFSTKGEELGQNILGRGLIGQYQYKNDKLDMVIVYPSELATGEMIYPFPGY
jgi:branched-chain amino acid transport system substrate-binding protein